MGAFRFLVLEGGVGGFWSLALWFPSLGSGDWGLAVGIDLVTRSERGESQRRIVDDSMWAVPCCLGLECM